MGLNRIQVTIDTDSGPIEFTAPLGMKPTFDHFTLDSFGERKIHCIKTVRAFCGLPLKDSKELVEATPHTFTASELRGVEGHRGLQAFADALSAEGATVVSAGSDEAAELVQSILGLLSGASSL